MSFTTSSTATNSPVRLTLSSNFLRNTSLDNDDLNIHYRFETKASLFNPAPLTKLYRYDAKLEKEVLVAEWKKNCWSSDLYRLDRYSNGEGDFTPVWEIMPNTWGFPCSSMFNRTFKSGDGHIMTWKIRACSLKLYRREEHAEGKGQVVAEFHRANYVFNSHKAYLELLPGYDAEPGLLDMIVLTVLFCERKRRHHARPM